MSQEGAQGRGEKIGAQKEALGGLHSPENCDERRRQWDLRRANSSCWLRDLKGREGVKREGVEGYKGEGSGWLMAASNVRNQEGEFRIETAVVEIEDDDVSMTSSNFFLFVFLFSFIIFDSGLQIKSNKFV